MQETKYHCDHCGKELNWKHDYIDTTIDTPWETILCDLCRECKQDLACIIKTFLEHKKEGKYEL